MAPSEIKKLYKKYISINKNSNESRQVLEDVKSEMHHDITRIIGRNGNFKKRKHFCIETYTAPDSYPYFLIFVTKSDTNQDIRNALFNYTSQLQPKTSVCYLDKNDCSNGLRGI